MLKLTKIKLMQYYDILILIQTKNHT